MGTEGRESRLFPLFCAVFLWSNEVFAKEVGFRAFQEINKNFEYRIIFDASLQREQEKFLGDVRSFA